MRVSYEWLKEFVDFDISPEELKELLDSLGMGVEAVMEVEGETVYELEITPNRPDLLGVYGIAREVSAALGVPLAPLPELPPCGGKHFPVRVEDEELCGRYTLKVVRGVKVGSSPDWLVKRLVIAGMRSVNNVVDITNFVMLQYGHPLHAFDMDKLHDAIAVSYTHLTLPTKA